MIGVVCPDVSEFQVAVNDAYPHPWLSFRACDGTYRDHKCAQNLAWAKKAAAAGRLAGYTVYCVYRPGADTFGTLRSMIGTPDRHITVMIDVESWGGQIRGDHSSGITALANQIAAWLGSNKRVLAYGNQGDLASIYPHRPSWLRLIVAGYGTQQPNARGLIGWQYTDGQSQWPVLSGLPRSSAPFGHCDHNVFPGHTPQTLAAALGVGGPTPEVDMPLTDAEINKIAAAVWGQPVRASSGVTHAAGTWLIWAQKGASSAATALTNPSGVLARVAELQKSTAAQAQAAAVDAHAVAVAIRNQLVSLIGGSK